MLVPFDCCVVLVCGQMFLVYADTFYQLHYSSAVRFDAGCFGGWRQCSCARSLGEGSLSDRGGHDIACVVCNNKTYRDLPAEGTFGCSCLTLVGSMLSKSNDK